MADLALKPTDTANVLVDGATDSAADSMVFDDRLATDSKGVDIAQVSQMTGLSEVTIRQLTSNTL